MLHKQKNNKTENVLNITNISYTILQIIIL